MGSFAGRIFYGWVIPVPFKESPSYLKILEHLKYVHVASIHFQDSSLKRSKLRPHKLYQTNPIPSYSTSSTLVFHTLSETLHLSIIAIAASLFIWTCLVCAFCFKHAWGLMEPGKRLEGEHCYALFLTVWMSYGCPCLSSSFHFQWK